MSDISVIINLHREGRLCRPSIDSALAAVKRVNARGVSCEIVAVLDRGDAETARALDPYRGALRVETCDYGDLGLARNFGVERAVGERLGFLDGDDLMGEAWLDVAAFALDDREGRDIVVHPRMNCVFGRDGEPVLWLHPDMETDDIDLTHLRAANLWTALSFGRAELYRRFPYRANRIAEGFGFEDWAWNLETVSAGVTHIAPEGTIHFIRRKASGSLLAASDQQRILPSFRF